MESAAVLRSFNYAVCTSSHLKTVFEKPGMPTMNNVAFPSYSKLPVCGGNIISFKNRRESLFVSCVRTSDSTLTAKSYGEPNGAVLSENEPGIQDKKATSNATFPNGFEALLTEVCEETKIAELKLKIGAFQMHMKRNIDGPAIPAPVVHQAAAPPVHYQAAAPPVQNEPTPVAPPPPPESSSEKATPFKNVSAEKEAKLAALEASGSSGYVIVPCPMVGSFRRARTRKGKKQPTACKEGDVIKEGQLIGFVDQFGTDLPVRSDVAGEVFKFLYSDGEPVGYGDPLIAVLPSFHNIGIM